MSLKDRHESEIESFVRITYKDMVCKDCKYVLTRPQEVTYCKKYPGMKPGKVTSGGDCSKYEQ